MKLHKKKKLSPWVHTLGNSQMNLAVDFLCLGTEALEEELPLWELVFMDSFLAK